MYTRVSFRGYAGRCMLSVHCMLYTEHVTKSEEMQRVRAEHVCVLNIRANGLFQAVSGELSYGDSMRKYTRFGRELRKLTRQAKICTP